MREQQQRDGGACRAEKRQPSRLRAKQLQAGLIAQGVHGRNGGGKRGGHGHPRQRRHGRNAECRCKDARVPCIARKAERDHGGATHQVVRDHDYRERQGWPPPVPSRICRLRMVELRRTQPAQEDADQAEHDDRAEERGPHRQRSIEVVEVTPENSRDDRQR